MNVKLKRPKQSDRKNEMPEDESAKLKRQTANFSDRKSETSEGLPGRRSARSVRRRERLEDALAINAGRSAPDPDPETDHAAGNETETMTAAAVGGETAANDDEEIVPVKEESDTGLKK